MHMNCEGVSKLPTARNGTLPPVASYTTTRRPFVIASASYSSNNNNNYYYYCYYFFFIFSYRGSGTVGASYESPPLHTILCMVWRLL